MKIQGEHYETIWLKKNDAQSVELIDQTLLPFAFHIKEISTYTEMVEAIASMRVRGAPLIGVAAAYGLYLAAIEARKKSNPYAFIRKAANELAASRPTAVNLSYALNEMLLGIDPYSKVENMISLFLEKANRLKNIELENCRQIGLHGLKLIEEISAQKKGKTVNILTHCNAGWLACIDFGTATAPIYEAFNRGIDVHVWVDETRPRNQGARLTAWELGNHGVQHTIIVDNAGGHLMQHGEVDLVITGSDRTTRNGDVANKIGTYLKALAAYDNGIPFYVALPSSTIDWSMNNGIAEIPIEERDAEELSYTEGLTANGIEKVHIYPKFSPVKNYGFDVTPARLVSGLITEKGICMANEESMCTLLNPKLT